jgi:ectoine hydroxylase-related dioxygenase (phytanoyl-CoA dioxygenase family)
MLTAWIPLEDCPESAGPLAVIDGSHKWSNTDWMNTFTLQDFAQLEERLGSAVTPHPLVLKRGQISFHHAKTVHGSFTNRSQGFRTALAVHIQAAENAYVRALGPNGRPVVHMNDMLCRSGPDGSPDYADPSICLPLWP